ncbi:BEN domain-containing protein 6 isoform X1 [Ursus americanus]|uniref:BEN domain-containing protein 6 isoform X1 n=1 Tax=Ursus americanus TaxID=9643 RepID=UPI001E67CCCA|nr:BEN domain-containing protein 6 isoform X1 [Ursus americanus]XP_045658888.1 BEN domain-containing protein 6 isoform X1 [Ursus americanus]XP_045658897.1 BEN domain-containing protein 6 isoform X1 [Ursus americanus]
MQKILQTEDITNTQALRKGKRKRTETMDSENANSDMDKGQRDPYSGNAFLPGESASEDEEPLAELSKEELCTKIKSLKQKLTNTRKENSRLRQSLVMLQGNKLHITITREDHSTWRHEPLLLPQAVTQFEELVGMAEALLKGGGTMSTSASTLWRATNNSSPDSFASTCSNSNSNSSSPISLKAEEEHPTDEKQFKIEKWQIARCNKSKPQKFINDLMQVLYTNEYMATHSLTGAKSSTSRDKAVKPAMNQNEVQEIIGVTKQLFPNTDDVSIRRMIGQKLNNCTKKPNLSKNLNSQDIK